MVKLDELLTVLVEDKLIRVEWFEASGSVELGQVDREEALLELNVEDILKELLSVLIFVVKS